MAPSDLVEHSELLAQRIERDAPIVGCERVIASTYLGFGTLVAGAELHLKLTSAKHQAGYRMQSS